jgi:hypothetical protein
MKQELAHLQSLASTDDGDPIMLSPITMRHLLAMVAAGVAYVDAAAEFAGVHPVSEPDQHYRLLQSVEKADARLKKTVAAARADEAAWSAAPKGH